MFRVKNWNDFQHYKDRRPPWIKLHKTILEDRRWFALSHASKALAMCIWLLASEHEDPLSGLVTDDIEDLSFRSRQGDAEVAACIKELIKQGFIEQINDDASNVLAERYQHATPETETEAEAEAEAEAEKKEAARDFPKKPDPRDDKDSPKYDPIWIESDPIFLRKKDYMEMLEVYGGTDAQFEDWILSRARWYAEQPPERRSRWFMATWAALRKMADANGNAND